ncbi:MAG: hypothetical protein ACRCUY_02655 [Thermoguttaceae bacterium]
MRFIRFVGIFGILMSGALAAQELMWNGYRTAIPDKGNASVPTSFSADSPNSYESEVFFLLRTGLILKGTAKVNDSYYALTTEYGTINVPRENVEYIGETKEQIRKYKRTFINEQNINDLIKFAEWCLNHEMPDDALCEYQLALLLSPNEILQNYIQNRIRETQDFLSEAATSDENTPEKSTDTEPLGGKSRFSISKSALDSFAKKIEPVLVSRCAAADCHGSQCMNTFKLRIPHQVGGATTKQNIERVLEAVNFDHPSESPVLLALVTYHGGGKPAFNVESSQYLYLTQWIQMMTKEITPKWRDSQYRNAKQLSEPEEKAANKPSGQLPRQLSRAMPKTVFAPPSDSSPSAVSPQITLSPTSLSVPTNFETPSDTKVTDPLDPNSFNAKYHSFESHTEIK